MNSKNNLLTLIICAHALLVQSRLNIELNQFEALTEVLTTVLSNCKITHQNTVGILTSANATIKWSKESLKSVSIININDIQQFPRRTILEQNLHTFLITVPSTYHLKNIITTLRGTSLWNPSALYIILDDRTTQASCEGAYQFLKIMWKEELLSSTFACVDRQSSNYRMFTFNPFTSWAPKSWQPVNENNHHENHWTLLSQMMEPGQLNCDSLSFRKTRTLGGHVIKAIALDSPPGLRIDPEIKGLGKLSGLDGWLARIIWQKLNATVHLTEILNTTHYYEFLPLVSRGVYDLLLNSQYIFNKPNATTTYPVQNSGISILTRYPEDEIAYKKILKFMNPIFILAIAIVYLITVVFLEVFLHRGIVDSSLEVIRMTLTISMMRFPERSAFRIYLVTVFLLFMLTSSTFQSNLSSLLTSPSPTLTVDSTEELIESEFSIYTYHRYKNAIFDDVLFSRTKTVNHWDCSEEVKVHENAACVADRTVLLRIAFKKDLYLSKHRIQTLFTAFVVRPNWLLKDRVSDLLMHLSDGGLITFWWEKSVDTYLRKWMKKVDDSKRTYEVMKLKGLDFAFYILVLGLGSGLLAFFVEIGARRWKRRAGKQNGKGNKCS
ncbi:uncharacterized protein LOC143209717 [Lasioglossum baleicum]|uniref:uncharacterized protein LOC143209717 n=1 Tax=Lasioglossum baleicum TaxID=434251 RepID=UPI003FCDDD24